MKQPVAGLIVFSSLLLLAVELFATPIVVRTAAPGIVSKSQWGSMKEGEFYQDQPFDPYSQGPLGDPVAITVHHTTLPLGTNPPNPEEDRQKVLSIQRYHVSKGWGDVGYHFVIGSDGSIYEGRPLGYTGTHAPPNWHNIGVSIIGDFHTKEYPSETQLAALTRLTTWLCDRFDIDPTAKITLFEQSNLAVCGHRDWNATDCPGDRLYALLPNVRERIRAGLLASSPAYDARISVAQILPEVLLAGRDYQLTFAVRNTGYVAWSHLNQVGLESCLPDVLSVVEPTLKDGEAVAPLTNRTWQVAMRASSAGKQRLALQMAESQRRFGPELAWDVRVLPPEAFISGWLVAGPFPADSPDAAFAKDYFAGKPLDVLEVMDEASESAHGYSVTGEYRSGERNYRGEDGERVRDAGRYYRGEESFRLSLAGYKDGDLVLRRRIDSGVRDQMAYVYVNGQRIASWRSPAAERYRRWKDMDLVIPAHYVRSRDSVDVRLKSVRTKQWGCSSFGYTLLDSAEPLVSPILGDKAGELTWRSWKSDAGIVDLSLMMPGAESGAVYLATYVRSASTRWVEIRTGYNGYLKAWLNGKQALAGKGNMPNFPDTLRGETLLEKGWNRLLLKIVLEPGIRNLYIRLCDRDGEPLRGVKFGFEPADPGNPEWLACR